jgi:alginate O-acetyltransferase complex protein AlgJ
MLSRDEVISVYHQVLGRTPSEEEIGHHMGTVESLDGMLRVALDSEEYAVRNRHLATTRTPAVVNAFHPELAKWSTRPGTRSGDEIAIVGKQGWLFLCGGTNANLGQYVGEVEMEPSWLEEWQQVIAHRRERAHELGVALAELVVPDKLAVYEEHYPEELRKVGPRPIERLLALPEQPLLYPLAELRAAATAGTEVYLRTDTHLTYRGNALLFDSLCEPLGVEAPPELATLPLHSYVVSGDLGVKFHPQIVNVIEEAGSLGGARIVEDNRAEIEAVQGHIGTRRVFANENAPDPRTAIVFGDSFGFGAGHYQGVSWFMAQAFREVHFVWVPFGWDSEYVRQVGAEAVLVQGAERFVARVPHLEVDTAGLAAETLRRKSPLDVEQVFD